MTVKPGVPATPQPKTPPETGSDNPPQTSPESAPATSPAVGSERVGSAVREILGLKEGQNLSHLVVSASKSAMGTIKDEILAEVDTKLESLKPKVTPAEPSETEALKESLAETQKTVKNLTEANAAARAQAAESSRITAVGNHLTGLGISSELQVAFSTLVQNGHAEGLPKPIQAEDGSLVYMEGEQALPFAPVMATYLEGNQHWLATYQATGAGTKGSSARTPDASVLKTEIKAEDKSSIAKAYQEDEGAANLAMDSVIEASGNKVHMPPVQAG